MNWHVDTALLERYASDQLSDAGMASVELHVTGCPHCRSLVAARADGAARAQVKAALDERLDTPPTNVLRGALQRVGVNEVDARVVGATLALHWSWLAVCVLTLAFAVTAATTGAERVGLAAFLVAAPMVPLAGVGVAFGPRVDPTYEIATAAALPGTRIVLLRTLAVTAPVIPVIALLSLFLPVGPLTFAWVLPALGLAAASLALGTIVPLARAAAGLALLWLAGAGVSLRGAPRSSAEAFVEGFAAFRPSGQLLFAGLTAAALGLVALRRSQFETAR